MKITGAEWKEFEATGWPEGFIWDESVLDSGEDLYLENGNIRFEDTDVFTVPTFWCAYPETMDPGESVSIRFLIKAWRKVRSVETIVLTISKADVEAAKALFKERGWKIG